ncbi:MAG: hypothetical protein AAGB35_00040 [Pseudomonadota bacterium]
MRYQNSSLDLSSNEVSYEEFKICYQHGCRQIQSVSLTGNEWKKLTSDWELNNLSAAHERIQIAEYVAQFEIIVGRMTDTQFDVGGSYASLFGLERSKSNQMDCIDESSNTYTYLRILESENMLKWHTIEGYISRVGFSAGYPHTAVLIKEKESDEEFVVDSWFYDNGRPPVIVKKNHWKLGWKPQKINSD